MIYLATHLKQRIQKEQFTGLLICTRKSAKTFDVAHNIFICPILPVTVKLLNTHWMYDVVTPGKAYWVSTELKTITEMTDNEGDGNGNTVGMVKYAIRGKK